MYGHDVRMLYLADGKDAVAATLFAREDVDDFYLEYDDYRSGGFEPLASVPDGKTVVLGLVTTKRPQTEDKQTVEQCMREASRYIPLDRLCLSPQCGFASCEIGNKPTANDLYKHCRHSLKHRHSRIAAASPVRNRKSIGLKPTEADGTRFGDLEPDLIVGKNNQDAVLTMVDRLTGYTCIMALPNGKDAKGVANACIDIIAPIRKHVKYHY